MAFNYTDCLTTHVKQHILIDSVGYVCLQTIVNYMFEHVHMLYDLLYVICNIITKAYAWFAFNKPESKNCNALKQCVIYNHIINHPYYKSWRLSTND